VSHSPGEAIAHAAAQGIDSEAFPATVNSALFQPLFYAALATKTGQWANIAWSIAEPGKVYRETAAFKSTRPSGSGDPAQNSTGRSNPGFALAAGCVISGPAIRL
jgi:hypothetical protein